VMAALEDPAQNDRDIADYIMAMDGIMADEPLCAVQDWKIKRAFWMEQISRMA